MVFYLAKRDSSPIWTSCLFRAGKSNRCLISSTSDSDRFARSHQKLWELPMSPSRSFFPLHSCAFGGLESLVAFPPHQENGQSVFHIFEVFAKTSKTPRPNIFGQAMYLSREDPPIFEEYLYLCWASQKDSIHLASSSSVGLWAILERSCDVLLL